MAARNFEAPTGGLNTRDALDNMPPNDAVHMVNWVPEPGFVRSRKGYVPYQSLTPASPVETLEGFISAGSSVLIAGHDNSLINVTVQGAPDVLATGFNSNRWNAQPFMGKMIFMNDSGLDLPQVYDGATDSIIPIVITAGPTSTEDINNGTLFKGRMIYTVHNSDSIWYAEAGSYQGDLTEFPLGGVLSKGGSVIHLITWSRDAGAGMDDFLVAISSTGETLVYQGDDPGSVLGWELVQTFSLAKPIGSKRATERMASRHVMISEDGFLDLEDSMKGSISDYDALSAKISRTVKEVTNLYSANFGWQAVFFSSGNYLLFNIPVSENNQYTQIVMNTRNGEWTTFEGWTSVCYTVFDDKLYFGDPEGRIVQADFGPSDSGVAIECSATMAFSYLDSKEYQKLMTAVTLITNHPYPQTIDVVGRGDWKDVPLNELVVISDPSGEAWDVAEWDVSSWAGSGDLEVREVANPIRRPIRGSGWAVSVTVRQATAIQQVYWWSHTIEYTTTGVK